MNSIDLDKLINPTPKQREFFAATLKYRYVLYGGAGGGGKSYSLRWWCIRELLRLYGLTGTKNIRVGLFSMDYPTLQDRQISRIKAEIPDWLGELKETRAEGYNFKLRDEFGAGTIALRNLDDPSKYKSAEFAGIAVEELTENVKETFDDLRFRLRWPGVERPVFVAATNPGGAGHGWVKRLWIDRDFPKELLPACSQFSFVSAKVQDNPYLTQQYYEDLQTLPDDKRKAYAEGDWDIFAGQYFSEWRREVHVCEPFPIPDYWRVTRVGDWGEANPCAYLWIAKNTEGEMYVCGEVYGAEMSVEQQAMAIHAFERGKHVEKIGILDSACWDVTGRAKSIAEQFSDYKVLWEQAAKGPGSRVAGWQMVRRALAFKRESIAARTVDGEADKDGLGGHSELSGQALYKAPKLRVFSTCTNLIRTLPTLVHDKNKVEDLDTDGEDHAADALRYYLQGPIKAPRTPDGMMSSEDAAFMALARKRQ